MYIILTICDVAFLLAHTKWHKLVNLVTLTFDILVLISLHMLHTFTKLELEARMELFVSSYDVFLVVLALFDRLASQATKIPAAFCF